MSQEDDNENYMVIADAIANAIDSSANEIKKIEVVECNSDFEENSFLRDDTPYTNTKHYLNDYEDDDDDEDTDTENNMSKSKNMLYAPIFLDTSLPRKGWIQGCILCNAKTSNINYYRDDTYNTFGYMVYCCHFCKRAKKRNIEIQLEYNNLIIEYIDTYKEVIYKGLQKP